VVIELASGSEKSYFVLPPREESLLGIAVAWECVFRHLQALLCTMSSRLLVRTEALRSV
jgi:hypothetical protein